MIQHRIHSGYLIAVVLVLAFSRWVPHPPNAVPIAAMALFAGAFFSSRLLAFSVPLTAMVLSDFVIGFHSTVWYVYAGIMAIVLIGSVINNVTVVKVGVAAIMASIAFFLITNFGAWLHHDMYPQDLNGLFQAYVAGIPFLRNSILANLVFSYLVFYGLTSVLASFSPAKTLLKRTQ